MQQWAGSGAGRATIRGPGSACSTAALRREPSRGRLARAQRRSRLGRLERLRGATGWLRRDAGRRDRRRRHDRRHRFGQRRGAECLRLHSTARV
eukprot:4406423-Prymnesium_polylepis.2